MANKNKIVEKLITSNVGWDENDREWLMEQNTDRLQRMLPTDNKSNLSEGSGKAPSAGATDEEEAEGGNFDSQAKKTLGGKGKKVNNEESGEDLDETDDTVENEESDEDSDETVENEEGNEEVSLEEYINRAPAGIRELLNGGIAAMNAEKRKLIATITGNSRSRFTKNQLLKKEVTELRQLAALAAPTDNYEGAQGEAPVDNSEDIEGLALPTVNFEKSSKKAR